MTSSCLPLPLAKGWIPAARCAASVPPHTNTQSFSLTLTQLWPLVCLYIYISLIYKYMMLRFREYVSITGECRVYQVLRIALSMWLSEWKQSKIHHESKGLGWEILWQGTKGKVIKSLPAGGQVQRCDVNIWQDLSVKVLQAGRRFYQSHQGQRCL